MSEQTRVAHPEDGLLSEDIEGFHFLAELALDMRSSWNHAADQLWLKLDPVLWDLTHNPWAVLQTVSREKLQRILADPDFRKNVDDLVQARWDHAQARAWFQQAYPQFCCAYRGRQQHACQLQWSGRAQQHLDDLRRVAPSCKPARAGRSRGGRRRLRSAGRHSRGQACARPRHPLWG